MNNIKCKICGREFNSLTSLSRHISVGHKVKIEEYYLKYINPEKVKCAECENYTHFINLRHGYHKYCGYKCSNNSEEFKNKKKDTMIKKYGCEYPLQNEKFKNKHKETCKKNFGFEHPSQCEEIKNKKKETCKKNFGVEHPSQCEEIKNKSKETCKKNFGTEYPMQNKDILNKTKETCKERFGCECVLQSDEIKNKIKDTRMKNFGFEYPMQNKEFVKKIADLNKLNFQKVQERYPDLVKIEELISGSNGEILGHCKNHNCKNSKENGGYFELHAKQIWIRNIGINSDNDTDYFYCCDECKQECPLFRKSAAKLHNFFNEDPEIHYTQNELLTFRNEVLSRQLLENKEHTLNYCEICHSTEDLQVHHIQPQKLEPGYALDPPNGIILCQKCHLEKGHEKGSDCSTSNLSNKFCK